MADMNLDTPSFGIVDTIASSSQELVDAFLDGDTSTTTNPEDVKDIKEEEPTPPKKTVKNTVKEEEKEEVKEEEKEFSLDDIKDENEEEQEEATTKKEEQKEESEENKETEEEYNPFEAFSKELFEINAFVKEEGEEVELPKDGKGFLDLMNNQVAKRAEVMVDNFIAKFGQEYQDAFQAIFVDGVNPKEYYQTYNEIQSFSEMDLSDEASQEAVIRQKLKDLEYDEEDIKTEIQRLKDYGDLKDSAEKYHKVLIKKEAQKLQQKAEESREREKQKQLSKQQFSETITKVLQDKLKTKEFDGIPINPRLAGELHDMLVTEKWKNSAGETLTDFDVEILNLKRPENHELKVKYALLLKLLKEDPTLSTIKKAGVTKETNTLFQTVVKNKPKSSTSTKSSSSSHWSNL